jgi:ABC-type polysaccharide/polyol phosphate export permease
MATVVSHLIHFLLALIVLVALLILVGLPPTLAYLWLIPLIALQCMLTLAVAMTLSALNVFYRDVGSIWEVLVQAWFYATPVIYPAWMVTNKIEKLGWPAWTKFLYLCNPLTPIVLAYRKIFLYDSAAGAGVEIAGLGPALALCVVVTLALLGGSWLVFRRYARAFADEL